MEEQIFMSKVVWYIGLASLFINFATIFLVTLGPTYLTLGLGLTLSQLGIYEGLSEFFSWTSRIVAGILCDFLVKRTPVLTLAYLLISISKTIWPATKNFSLITLARVLDRIGNGLGAPPRESLVADHSSLEKREKAYGIRQSMGQAGSLLGAIVLFFFLSGRKSTNLDFHYLFILAAILSLFSLLTIIFLIKDRLEKLPENNHHSSMISNHYGHKHLATSIFNNSRKAFFSRLLAVLTNVIHLPLSYWVIIAIIFLFNLANFSPSFVSIYAINSGNKIEITPVIMILYNLFAALSAVVSGTVANKFNSWKILLLAFMFMFLGDLLLWFNYPLVGTLVGISLWGCQLGITQGLIPAMISHKCRFEERGVAFGVFYLLTGLSLFMSNIIFGGLFKNLNPATPFLIGAVWVFIIGILLFFHYRYLDLKLGAFQPSTKV